jgi:hypothetical protein
VLEQHNTVKTPVCIGGLGGGGTRVFAFFLKLNGYYLGSDLNDALDNLWYTLLFKRRPALLDPNSHFEVLADVFFSAMQGDTQPALKHLSLIESLVNEDRIQESKDFLQDRFDSLIHHESPIPKNNIWGWKEPNTHILIDRFLDFNKELKYIHVLRDPYYMAYSKNQNQFMNWGSIFFGADKEFSPRNSLKFWLKSYERIIKIKDQYSERILIVKYEDMIERTELVTEQISSFLGLKATQETMNKLNTYIHSRPFKKEGPQIDAGIFDAIDIEYIRQFQAL